MKGYTITFVPLSSKIPAMIRVRNLLKHGLRNCSLKATGIQESEIPEKSKGKADVKN